MKVKGKKGNEGKEESIKAERKESMTEERAYLNE